MPWFLRPRRLIQAVVLATVAFAIWATSLPSLPDGRINPNESAAIATLKHLCAVELQFMAQQTVDRDGDGRGEAGFFEELTGSALPRRASLPAAGRRREPAKLSSVFAVVDAGRVRNQFGYWFQIHLPTANGRWVGQSERADAVGIDASEGAFCIYAWPQAQTSGRRAFFVDASGEVMSCGNADWRYCGRERPVPVDAALPSSDAGRDAGEPGGRIGRDGQRWCVVD